MNTFTCKKCNIDQPLTEFAAAKENTSGHKLSCRSCTRKYYEEWKNRKPDEVRQKSTEASRKYAATHKGQINSLKKRAAIYGLTPDEYDEVLSRNNGLCAICKVRPATHLDHCHTSSTVRGALCLHCNTGLGNFLDNTVILAAAIDYLNITSKSGILDTAQ